MSKLTLIIQLLSISYILFSIIRYYLIFKLKKGNGNNNCVLKIYSNKNNEIGPVAIESFLSNIIIKNKKRTLKQWFFKDKTSTISLELANIDQKIFLSIYCQIWNKDIIKNQIYAQYNDIEIEEIDDYTKQIRSYYQSNNKFIGAELKITDPYIYPIKRYMQFEDRIKQTRIDPIGSIFSSLSNTNSPGEKIVIQIVMNRASEKWRIKGQNLMKSLSTGIFLHSDKLRKKYSQIFLNLGHFQILSWSFIKIFDIFLGWYGRGVGAQSKAEQSAEEKVDKSNENPLVAASSKIARLGICVNIRMIYCCEIVNGNLKQKIEEMISSFHQFNQPHLNSFAANITKIGDLKFLRKFRNRKIHDPFILNTEEIATIWHIPEQQLEIPNLEIVKSKKIQGPLNLPMSTDKSNVCTIGRTSFRNDKRYFGIGEIDRRRHVYIIGKTGMGKSSLLENMINSDIQNGKGVGIIDPHGDLCENILKLIPKNRINDVVLIDPSDKGFPVSLNMLECNNPNQYNLVASSLIGVFKKLYSHSWGPRLEHILRNAILALVENQGTTILGILKILENQNYRNKILRNVKNPTVKSFWYNEFNKWDDRQKAEAVSPIQNKIGQFLSSPIVRNILGQIKSTIDIRFSMDKGKIIIINLSKGKIGEDNSSLLGSMLITKFQLDAMSRAEISEDMRKDFYLYVDEFQNFATDSFANILSEARKYKLNLNIANQYIGQMPEEVKLAVFGNVGSLITFQVGYDDAFYLENQFSKEVLNTDIISLGKYQCYMKLLIDGMPSNTFSASTLNPVIISNNNYKDTIIKTSRERYGRSIKKVEAKIYNWFKKD